MRFAQSTSAFAVLFALSVLAACGGGGGGGSVTPPGGGGGGGGPSPTPTAVGTATPSPAATATPTPAPTLSPTPAPTATPTPTPLPSATPSRTTIAADEGGTGGNDTMFTGGVSAAHEVSDGDYPAGGHGPLNSTIGPDNVPCLISMFNGPIATQGGGYHVHAFIGMMFNGSRIALPDGIGFADPEADTTFNGINNWTARATTCYYETHTHDASGLVHIESATAPMGLFFGQYGTKYTLGDVLAVWGIPVSPTNWGPLNGNVTIYTSGPVARGGPPGNASHFTVSSTTYTQFCTACTAATAAIIPLYSHEVIWVLVGTGNPQGSSLPNVRFGIEW